MSDYLSDEVLRENLILYAKERLAELPDESEIDRSPFSSAFERKMRKLLHRRAASYWPMVSTLGRRVATFVLSLLVLSGCLMSVEAIRVPFLQFVVEVFETFSRVHVEGDAGVVPTPETLETLYVPKEIPEGFVLMDEMREENIVMFYFVNGEDFLDWTQYCQGFVYHLDTEGTQAEEFNYDGMQYLYYSNKGIQNFIWQENGYTFTCAGTLPKDILFTLVTGDKKTF